MKMGEYRPGNEVDEFLYTRLLSWLDVLEMLCDMAPGTDWKDAVLLEFYTFTGRDGPMKWIVEDGGEDLGDVFVDAFLARTELRGLGMTLKKIIELFAVQKCNEPTRQSDTSRKRTRCDIG
jgi:hypothetical protein